MASPELDGLWREVRAQPDDDAALAVLGDALQAAGDPRGELIALELAVARGTAGEGAEARIAELCVAHGRTWVGDLAGVVRCAQIVRGMVRAIDLAVESNQQTERERERLYNRALAAESLSGIEAIARGYASGVLYAKLMTCTAATALRAVEVFDDTTLRALETTPLSFKRIYVNTLHPSRQEFVEQLHRRILPACERHAPLAALGVPAWAVAPLAGTNALDRLRELVIGGTMREGIAHWSALPRALIVTIVQRAAVDDCGTNASDATITLATQAGHLVARLGGSWLLQSIDDAIAMLPTDVSRIELADAAPELVVRARGAVGARGVDLVTLPPTRGHVLQIRR
jgi:uncharacterized protein (TIGR02996 family)